MPFSSYCNGAGERARPAAMAIAPRADGRLLARRTAITGAAEGGRQFGLDEGFDPVAHALTHSGFDRVDPGVEKPGFRLTGWMHGMGLADKVRHGVVSRGTAALQRPNPGEWVATPGDYATLSKVHHIPDGTQRFATARRHNGPADHHLQCANPRLADFTDRGVSAVSDRTEANGFGFSVSISADCHFAGYQSVALEFLVNDKTEFAQHASALTPLPEGGFASAGSMLNHSLNQAPEVISSFP